MRGHLVGSNSVTAPFPRAFWVDDGGPLAAWMPLGAGWCDVQAWAAVALTGIPSLVLPRSRTGLEAASTSQAWGEGCSRNPSARRIMEAQPFVPKFGLRACSSAMGGSPGAGGAGDQQGGPSWAMERAVGASNATGKTPPHKQHSLPRGTGGGNCGSWGLRIWGPGRTGREQSCEVKIPAPLRRGAPSQYLPDTHTSICCPFLSTTVSSGPSGLSPGTGAPFRGGLPASYSPPQIRAWARGPPLRPFIAVVAVELGMLGSEKLPPIFGAPAPSGSRKEGRGTEGKREQQGETEAKQEDMRTGTRG